MAGEVDTESSKPLLKTCLELSSRLRPYQNQPSTPHLDGHVSWQDDLTDESTGIGVDTEICTTSDGSILWQRMGFRFPRPPELDRGIYSKTYYPNCYVPVVWDRTSSQLSAALWLTKPYVIPLMSQPLLMEISAYGVKSLTPETPENLHRTAGEPLEDEDGRLAQNTFQLLKSLVAAVVKYGRLTENQPAI